MLKKLAAASQIFCLPFTSNYLSLIEPEMERPKPIRSHNQHFCRQTCKQVLPSRTDKNLSSESGASPCPYSRRKTMSMERSVSSTSSTRTLRFLPAQCELYKLFKLLVVYLGCIYSNPLLNLSTVTTEHHHSD